MLIDDRCLPSPRRPLSSAPDAPGSPSGSHVHVMDDAEVWGLVHGPPRGRWSGGRGRPAPIQPDDCRELNNDSGYVGSPLKGRSRSRRVRWGHARSPGGHVRSRGVMRGRTGSGEVRGQVRLSEITWVCEVSDCQEDGDTKGMTAPHSETARRVAIRRV